MDGEVVGINSQIYSRTGGFMGLSFSIPIEMAMNVAEQLRTKGKVSRGWLGVLIQDVTRELADSFGMKHPQGALVAKVLPDSPAEKAGLQVGDVILKYNGKELYNSSMLPPLVGSSSVNQPAEVLILRDGKRQVVEIKIGELPSDNEMADAQGAPAAADDDLLGLVVTDITPQIKKRLGLDSAKGVLVEEVHAGAASAAGIRTGDIIQMINNHRVSSVEEFQEQVEKLEKGKTTAVLVLRRNGPIFLALRVPED